MNVVERVRSETAPWIERTARMGFAAKGVVYLIIGVLAFRLALGKGGETTDSRGALREILQAPFGQTLLGIVAVGLFGYLVWRLVDATADASGRGHDAKGMALRVSTAAKGIAYGALGVEAIRLSLGKSGSSGEGSRHWIARALDLPAGKALVVAAGAFVVGYGLYQLVRAWKVKLNKRLRLGALDTRVRSRVVAISRFGIAARAIVFLIIGYFLVMAGLHADPSEARGVGEALGTLRGDGPLAILLLTVSAGLAAYGIYELVNARYRMIDT